MTKQNISMVSLTIGYNQTSNVQVKQIGVVSSTRRESGSSLLARYRLEPHGVGRVGWPGPSLAVLSPPPSARFPFNAGRTVWGHSDGWDFYEFFEFSIKGVFVNDWWKSWSSVVITTNLAALCTKISTMRCILPHLFSLCLKHFTNWANSCQRLNVVGSHRGPLFSNSELLTSCPSSFKLLIATSAKRSLFVRIFSDGNWLTYLPGVSASDLKSKKTWKHQLCVLIYNCYKYWCCSLAAFGKFPQPTAHFSRSHIISRFLSIIR